MILPELVDTLQPEFTPGELQPADDVLFSLPVVSRYLALAFPRRNTLDLLVKVINDFHRLPPFRAFFFKAIPLSNQPWGWSAARQPCIWEQRNYPVQEIVCCCRGVRLARGSTTNPRQAGGEAYFMHVSCMKYLANHLIALVYNSLLLASQQERVMACALTQRRC